MTVSLLSDWFTTISLVFGGCCSNAITLEQLTLAYPHAGSLITFFQFILISIHGLPKHLMWTRYGPRFRPRRIPLTPYLIQVALFYFVSLLNNKAFAYRIPMAVHIIFRSAGLVVSMVLGWLFNGKKYTPVQIFSVLLVTLGVILTTLSASTPTSASGALHTPANPYTYATGIAILTIALVLSGFLGQVQDWTYSTYGRPAPPGSSKGATHGKVDLAKDASPAWQESMFYLHFLALPMFLSVRSDLLAQITAVNAGPRVLLTLPITPSVSLFPRSTTPISANFGITIPTAYLPLLLNTLTQLVCVAGVHRLTTRVSSLSVTLVLVVRKAVSLVLSVLGFGMMGRDRTDVDQVMMWTGAAMVLIGTVIYSVGSGKAIAINKDKTE